MGTFKQNLAEHAHIVNWVTTCAEAKDALTETSYDLILVDIGLPDGDGLTPVREWSESGFSEPILILSARDSREDRVKGLDLDRQPFTKLKSGERHASTKRSERFFSQA